MILKDFNHVYKLHGGEDPLGLLGQMIREPSVRTNAGKMSATVTITTANEDRSGDIVVTKGIRTGGHEKNPIVLLNHKQELGIGFTQDRLGNYTVKRVGDTKLVGEVFFNQSTQLGLEAFKAVESRIIRGVSIGFLPIIGKIEKRHQRGTIYHESNLIEVTLTPIGDNEDAIIEAVHKTFGSHPPCDELASVLPKWERKIISHGYGNGIPSFDLIAKGNTYKTAEAKEVEPRTRSSTYYVCPHCDKEITHEHIHKDEDGTTRHGECRGALVFKKPEHVDASPEPDVGTHPTVAQSEIIHHNPTFPKSLRYVQPKRFLPLVHKLFNPDRHPRNNGRFTKLGNTPNTNGSNPMPDNFDPNGTAVIDDMDQADEFAPPADDDMGSGMKSGAEAHHGVNDILMQCMQFIEDSGSTVDNATAKKTLEKVSKWISKAMAALHSGHQAYLGEHPDQPELPGAEGIGLDDGDDSDDDGEDDSVDDDDDLDADLDGEDEDGPIDDSGEDKPKKKKKPFGGKEDKAIREWRTKAINAYWESVKKSAAIGDADVIAKTIAALKGDIAYERRTAVKNVVKDLEAMLVTKELKTVTSPMEIVNEWETFLANGTITN